MARRLCVTLLIFAALPALPSVAASPRPFTQLPQTFTDAGDLEALTTAIAHKSAEESVLRIEALLSTHADELMSQPLGARLCVAAQIDQFAPEVKAMIAPAYRAKFDAAANDVLQGVLHNPGYRVAELYAVARRYPLSSAAPQALVLAGDRALQFADADSALALYQCAQRDGWVPDDLHTQRLQAIATLAAPASFAGPVPFDAPWYASAIGYPVPRIFPTFFDDRVLLYTDHRVLAVDLTGKVLWSSPAAPPRAWPNGVPVGGDPSAQVVRGALCVPAVLPDFTGRAQIVIARQPPLHSPPPPNGPLAHSDAIFALHAFRAGDGKLLWSTEDQDISRDLSFAGPPVIAGRQTFAVALTINTAGDYAKLLLVALDTLNGQVLWETDLGSYTFQRGPAYPFGERRPWEDLWDSSPVAVCGDAIYASPNIGSVIAADRFEGKVRWTRPYQPALFGPARDRSIPELRRQAEVARRQRDPEQRVATTGPGAPQTTVDALLACRYLGTPRLCKDVLVCAPQDSPSVFTLDAGTGRILAARPDLASATLVACTDTAAIFADTGVSAMSARDGSSLWTWAPPRGSRMTGPPAPWGNLLLIPTTDGVEAIALSDGSPAQPPAGAPVLRRLLLEETLRPALEEAGALQSLGLAPAPQGRGEIRRPLDRGSQRPYPLRG